MAGASPPPPASCISVAISHADAMCSATERRCACSASQVDVDQLTSCSYCRLVSLFRTLSFIRRKSRTTGSLQPPKVSKSSISKSVSERNSAWA